MSPQEEIEKYKSQLKFIDEELKEKFAAQRELEEKIGALKIQTFVESGVLREIGWKIKLNKKNILYLVPEENKPFKITYSNWVDRLLDSYKVDWNHYSIDMDKAVVYVNDYDVHISTKEGFDIVQVIRDLKLTIVGSEVTEKRQEIEKSLQEMKDLEIFLNQTK